MSGGNAPIYRPVFQLSRGDTVESIHYGAIAAVAADGRRLAWYGDPEAITFLRSSAKPFQAIPLIKAGGQAAFGLSAGEIALICASHSGTDEHLAVVSAMQTKVGVLESELRCGVHPPYDPDTIRALQARGEEPTPNRHNCSGKHTGMLAFARLRGWPAANYIEPAHPLQTEILQTFADLCGLPPDRVALGVDGCSAPNFAVPLAAGALAYARLCDPKGLPEGFAPACREITAAMTAHPFMVGGPGRFDTRLMEVTRGRLVAKGGAEGYQGIGLFPGSLGPGSPAVGIAVKIADGDLKLRARPAVVLEVLRQLGALDESELEELGSFGPCLPVLNWREIVVGSAEPCFNLQTPERNPPHGVSLS